MYFKQILEMGSLFITTIVEYLLGANSMPEFLFKTAENSGFVMTFPGSAPIIWLAHVSVTYKTTVTRLFIATNFGHFSFSCYQI